MGVDVDVSDAAQGAFAFQILDGDAAVVYRAETGGRGASRVVQACDWNERTPALAVHETPAGIEGRADHERGRLVDALESGRVTAVEIAVAVAGHGHQPVDVARVVKARQIVAAGGNGVAHADRGIEPLTAGFVPEGIHAVGAERMAVAECIAAQILTDVDAHGIATGHGLCLGCHNVSGSRPARSRSQLMVRNIAGRCRMRISSERFPGKFSSASAARMVRMPCPGNSSMAIPARSKTPPMAFFTTRKIIRSTGRLSNSRRR